MTSRVNCFNVGTHFAAFHKVEKDIVSANIFSLSCFNGRGARESCSRFFFSLGRWSTCLVSIPLYYALQRVIWPAELTELALQLSGNIASTMGDQVSLASIFLQRVSCNRKETREQNERTAVVSSGALSLSASRIFIHHPVRRH